jgi:hypothetical protein
MPALTGIPFFGTPSEQQLRKNYMLGKVPSDWTTKIRAGLYSTRFVWSLGGNKAIATTLR